ncbi:MAG: hypothetical protein KJ048_01810 [Dehalococcoidia bacterium]|nr:hypothetical protein [Dehalococcoidia bacterium]
MDNSSDDSESGNSAATDAAAAGDDALTDDSGKSSEDLMAHIKDRLRAIAEGDRTACAEAIEASGRHVTQQELDDFDSRGGAPLVAAMRQHEFLLGDVAPESTLGQRWEQWQKDLRDAANSDRAAFIRVHQANGVEPSAEDLAGFDLRGGPPLIATMRQHQLLVGDVAPESTLGQRWEQWQKDLRAMDDGDRDAFIRASQANGVAPSAEDLAGFDLRGGPPVLEAARRQQLWGHFDPGSKLGQRLDRAMEDMTKARQGDVEAARRLEVQTGHPGGTFAGADGSGGGQDPAEADRGGFDWLQPAPGGGTGLGPDVGTGPEPEASGGTKLGDVHDSDVGPGSDPGEWNPYPSNAGDALTPPPHVPAGNAPAKPANAQRNTTTGESSSSESSPDGWGTTIEAGGSSETYHSEWRSDGTERREYADGSVEYRDSEGNVIYERTPKDGTPSPDGSEASTDSDTNTNEGTTDDDDAEADEDPEEEDDADTESGEGSAAARTGAAEESDSLPDRVGIGALQDSPSGYVDRLTDYGPDGAPRHGAGDGADVRLPSRDPIALYGDGDARPGATGEAASGFVDPLTDYGPGGAPRHEYGPGDVKLPSHEEDPDPRAAGDGVGSMARGDSSALTQASLETPGHGSLVGLAGSNDSLGFESSTLFDLSHETAGLEVHHDSFATVADMALDLDGPPEANGAGGLDWLDDD